MVTINRRAAARLRQGHLWVYRSDMAEDGKLQPASLAGVADERGNLIGTALYSSTSKIALRMVSSGPVADFSSLLRQRLQAAVRYREQLVRDSDAYRVVFSEADSLPGLMVDRYSDIVSIQILIQAMDAPAVRETLVNGLMDLLHPAGIVERVEERIRELEHMQPRQPGLLAGEKTQTQYTMNAVHFLYDGLAGQKTGAFLDQRENYAAAARYAHGEALDVFTYQGGFALHLARVCRSVTAVDSSRAALDMAEQNAALNGAQVEWIEANAFDLLKDWSVAGRHFDTIVLDPPAFAKSRRELGAALRGYKELNLRALKMLRPGGVLVTCSCSHHVSEQNFVGVVAEAAADARRPARLLEKRGQAKDHPVLLGVPETAYLKCLVVGV